MTDTPKHTPGPCACKVSGVTLARPVINATLDVLIDYCPLHAAAPAMREALAALVASLTWEEKRSGTTYHGIEQARAALALAESK